MSAWAWAGSSSGQGGRRRPAGASCPPWPGPGRCRQLHQGIRAGQPGRHGRDELRGHRVAVVEQRDLAVRGQHAAQPVPHPGDRLQQFRGGRLAGRPEQLREIDQVGEDLAVIGGGPLVVTPVRQDLHRQLSGQGVQDGAQLPFVPEEHRETGERLEVLDQVIAADVGLQVPAQEPGVRRQAGQEGVLDRTARDQVAVQPAEGPGPQGRRIGQPGIAAAPPRPSPARTATSRRTRPARPPGPARRPAARPSPSTAGGSARARVRPAAPSPPAPSRPGSSAPRPSPRPTGRPGHSPDQPSRPGWSGASSCRAARCFPHAAGRIRASSATAARRAA